MPAAVHLNPKAPRRPLANWVEWRAGSIQDPVRRLGYLRGSAEYWSKRPIRKALLDAKAQRLSAFLAVCLFFPVPMITDGAASRPGVAESASIQPLPKIWQVEATASHELYSNGLRVEKTFQARPDGPRKFQRWSIATSEREERDTPYGIVFHMTESDAIDYRENNNRHLRRASLGTMEFVRNERAYHFVVDRFGRVFRTVPENEPANHAGNSIWADKTHFYVNMNHSFLGVSFDGQT
ncbi:MAG: N-acetylmuramoyl-L-alanine amidase, partial [Acidobacteria bacterium]|nr:N-acetylmuramoyl-L-alanine amidase [Acidobacteriota bacterium]